MIKNLNMRCIIVICLFMMRFDLNAQTFYFKKRKKEISENYLNYIDIYKNGQKFNSLTSISDYTFLSGFITSKFLIVVTGLIKNHICIAQSICKFSIDSNSVKLIDDVHFVIYSNLGELKKIEIIDNNLLLISQKIDGTTDVLFKEDCNNIANGLLKLSNIEKKIIGLIGFSKKEIIPVLTPTIF